MTTAAAQPRPPLWASGRSRLLFGSYALAVLAILVASLGARYTSSFGQQSNWAALAAAGLVVGMLASATWLLRGCREVCRRRLRLAQAAAVLFSPPATTAADGDRRLATLVMRHYHRSHCQMVRGKDLVAARVDEHQRAGRTACAVCEA